MTPERWQQIEQFYLAALERKASERADFLRQACDDDAALLHEVQSLLDQQVSEKGFMATATPIVVGQRLGPYHIQALIGRGGMGEVYRARDTRLGRDVAIKLLPHLFVSDPDRRARFEREARMLATLNHPHIGAIYGLEVTPDQHALVLELVEGDTLADRVANGALPVAEVMTIARQIAEALAAAHERGIIHRDLKPANIKITPDGMVKVLDFGLAKLADDSALPTSEQSPSPLHALDTHTGMILGTATYMSPEQARGQPVDKRTDIWAFGCVLYEMLSGRRAFAGEDVSDTLARVLMKDPDWEALPASTPPAIRKLLHRCLAKDRRQRLSDASDVRLELEDAQLAPVSEAVVPLPARKVPTWRRIVPFGTAALIAGLVAGVAVMFWVQSRTRSAVTTLSPTTSAPLMRTTIELPASAPLVALGSQIPPNGWNRPVVALSPDGAHLAYVGWSGTNTLLYRRDLSGTEIRPVAGSEGAIYAFFSPDSEWLGFLTNDKVKKISLNGGAAITLCDAKNPVQAWWRNDVIYFDENEGTEDLSSVSAEGGRTNSVTTLAAINAAAPPFRGRRRFSDVLPDGKFVLTTVWSRGSGSADYAQVELVSLENKKAQVLARPGYGARFVAPGYIVFARAGNLLAARFDVERKEVHGQALPLVTGASMESNWGLVHAAAANSGLLAYVPGRDLSVGQLAWMDRKGTVEPLQAPERIYGAVRLAPNGTRLASLVADVTDYIWVYDLERREGRRLPGTENSETFAWSPDSLQLAFRQTLPGAPARLLRRNVDGGAAPTEIASENADSVLRWSPDGKTLGLAGRGAIRFISLDGKEEHTAPNIRSSNLWDFSPDGRWLAYTSAETGQFEIWVRSHPDGKVIRQVSVDGGVEPVWCRCGELFYRRGNRWFSTKISSTRDLRWDVPRLAFATDFIDSVHTSYDVSADGQRLLVAKRPALPGQRQLHIVTNWFEALNRKSP